MQRETTHRRINITLPIDLHDRMQQMCKTTGEKVSRMITRWGRKRFGYITEDKKIPIHNQIESIRECGFTIEGLLSGLYLYGRTKEKSIIEKEYPEIARMYKLENDNGCE